MIRHMTIKVGEMIRVEYIDHATIKGDISQQDLPPVLIAIGIVESIKDTFIILKSMWSRATGETKTRQLIVKSCIIKIQRLIPSKKEVDLLLDA